jgi:LysM repeat protein
MNTPNPLVPQGSLERQSKGKSTARIAVFTIISIHAVFFAGLLMQGCRPDQSKTPLKSTEVSTNQNSLPPIADPGYYTPTQDVAVASNPSPHSPVPSSPAVGELPLTTLPPATTPESLVTDGKSYTIAKGDTLKKIAISHGVSLKALSQANPNVDPTKLKVGQKIQIPAAPTPAGGELGLKEPGKLDSATGNGSIHTVKAGETLGKIAKQHGTTPKAIRSANNMKTDRLVVGQKLRLPAGQAAGSSSDIGKSSASPKLTAKSPSRGSTNPLATGATNLQ